jgi:hypothetical protein
MIVSFSRSEFDNWSSGGNSAKKVARPLVFVLALGWLFRITSGHLAKEESCRRNDRQKFINGE